MASASSRFHFHGAAVDQVLERCAIQKFHGDERFAFVFPNIVNRADVRMIQRAGGLGFPLETRKRLGILGEIIGEEFQRDKPMQPRVLGFVDHTHAAAAEFFDDPVVRNRLPDK